MENSIRSEHMELPKSLAMLKSVSWRIHLVRWAFQTFLWTMAAGIVYGVLLLASRFTGYGEDFFPTKATFAWDALNTWTLALVPAIGIVMGTL
ncbi:MAG: hypothetical protein CMJ46_15580, partial [Planctomyces sp.]|nr:hypothetical protein [Planctomyces sp.]